MSCLRLHIYRGFLCSSITCDNVNNFLFGFYLFSQQLKIGQGIIIPEVATDKGPSSLDSKWGVPSVFFESYRCYEM